MTRPLATTTARGYGAQHQAQRRHWAKLIESGTIIICPRCGRLIRTGEPWDLGHAETDRTRYTGPEHRSCNRTAGARNAARVTNAKQQLRVIRVPPFTSRRW